MSPDDDGSDYQFSDAEDPVLAALRGARDAAIAERDAAEAEIDRLNDAIAECDDTDGSGAE